MAVVTMADTTMVSPAGPEQCLEARTACDTSVNNKAMKTKEAADGRLFFVTAAYQQCEQINCPRSKPALRVRLRTYEQDGDLLKRLGLVIWPVSSPLCKKIPVPV
jgi:hypothetical protein